MIPKKNFAIDRACAERELLRNIGKEVVITKGCFDLAKRKGFWQFVMD